MTASIAYTPKQLTAAQASGQQGRTHRSGQQLPADGLSRFSTPVNKIEQMIQQLTLVYDRLWDHLMPLRAEHVSGLTIAVPPGGYRDVYLADKWFAGNPAFVVEDDSSDLKVWIDVESNGLDQGLTWPADKGAFAPICRLTAAGGTVVPGSIIDCTNLVRMALTGSASEATSTAATEFLFASGETEAGNRTLLLRLTAEVSVALRWANALNAFALYADVAIGTLAPLVVRALSIGAAEIIDEDGYLRPVGIDPDTLYVFGANGATPNGLALVAMATPGAPTGAHAKGELAIDSAGTLWACTAAGNPATWQAVAKQNGEEVLSIVDAAASAGNAAEGEVQIKDQFGVDRAAARIFDLYLCADTDGAADAPNTSGFVVTTGTLLRTVTANKHFRVKTDATGLLVYEVTNSIAGTVHVLCDRAPGSGPMNCSDRGVLTWS